MNIFFWRKNKEIDAFAFQLADELYSDIQPGMAGQYLSQNNAAKGKEAKKATDVHNRVTRRHNEIITKVQQYRAVHSLGIYGKARLHLTFTERLKELGYSQATAKEFNQIILLRTP